jgi:hypothetical protein
MLAVPMCHLVRAIVPSLLLFAATAGAQTVGQLKPQMEPTLQVLGVYSPKGNRPEYEAFLDREVGNSDPINFSDNVKALLIRRGRGAELVALSDKDKRDIREEVDRELSTAVLIEIAVAYPDASFSVDAFVQPNPGVPASQWQAPWLERFLSADGTALLDDVAHGALPRESHFRVVFYIHDWEQEHGLDGPYGAVALLPMQPMPERLWRLAPYERVD